MDNLDFEELAARVNSLYGSEIYYEDDGEIEGFECPECQEPILKIDYPNIGIGSLCPICGFFLD